MSNIRKLEWALVAIGFAFLVATALSTSEELISFLALAGFVTATAALAFRGKNTTK